MQSSSSPSTQAAVGGELLQGTPYAGYLYSYPHKTSYRPLAEPSPLRTLWRSERREALFLYVHVPFCEMRCGFCNLLTKAYAARELITAYLAALERQARAVASALAPARFARAAVGGGTPTQLQPAQLARLLELMQQTTGAELTRIPTSVETSPETATAERLRLLRDFGVDRISIGVQSFVADELRALHRRQQEAEVEAALEGIRALGFPTLNIDLIYGIEGQDERSWDKTLRRTLDFAPEEIYLYPLYVRPLTVLGLAGRDWDDQRLALYHQGRRRLLEAGYRQVSMRMFRLARLPAEQGPVYCCQADGMVGLGPGARSYTRTLHYSSEYAVGARGVAQIIGRYSARSEEDFARADYGVWLDDEDQRRRFVILSLLTEEGLSRPAYRQRFGSEALEDLPQLQQLLAAGWARAAGERVALTAAGIERSDAIGPWLISRRIRRLMQEYRPR